MDAALQAEALLVIGTQESDLTWNAVDYESNIKVGVAQWAGRQAAGLLAALDASDRQLLTQTLQDDLQNHNPDDAFWRSKFLTKDEGNSIITALGTATAKPVQVSYFNNLIDIDANMLQSWGAAVDTVDHQKTMLFLLAVYHVDLVAASRIVAAIGAVAQTSAILAALLNMPDIAGKRDWGATKALIDTWEGVEPVVQPTETTPNTDPGGSGQQYSEIPQVESQIQRIGMTGQQLIVYGKDNPQGVVCYRDIGKMWIPQTNTAAPPTPTPINPPAPVEPGTQEEFARMRQLWYDNEEAWSYSNGPGRMDPPASGVSDCSACIIWAVGQVRPDLAAALGDWTGSMVNAGTEIQRGYTGDGASIDLNLLQPGDILLVGTNYEFTGSKAHVEWYFGNGELWGAGLSPLPHRTGDVNWYLQFIASRGKTHYMFRRFL